ncbi:MAG: VOC family protein [Holophagaceae bacterium]|nr:VOC family protein [Holophagaceae bacterium]
MVQPVPSGYHTVTPYLVVPNALAFVGFLEKAFDAVEQSRTLRPDGTIAHAEVQIGDSRVRLAQAKEPWTPMPTGLYLYVPDTDATYEAALAAGGLSLLEPGDQFYGDRTAGVQDPWGNNWWIATHLEDVDAAELQRRLTARG